MIIAEDTGGNSLVKGIDIDNRDNIMLNLLKKYTNNGESNFFSPFLN